MAHAKSTNPDEFILPDLGEGVHEAELIKWRVRVGQHVREHDILAEMETDKALVEVPSPRDGTIAALHGKEGDILKVGSVLVSYEPGPGGARRAGAPAATPAPMTTEPKPSPAENGDVPPEHAEDAGTVVGRMHAEQRPAKALATPAVRRLARDLGIDIETIRGTGIGGRVMEKDVRAAAGAVSHAGPAAPAPAPAPAARPRETPAPTARAGVASGRPAAPEPRHPAPAPAAAAPARAPMPDGTDVLRIPFRGVRRTIANRLRQSVDQAVHFTVMDEADITDLDKLRRKLAAASGEKVSVLPFVCAAVCRVLTSEPFRPLNATVEEPPAGAEGGDAFIVQHRAVHLGIATDTDTGLMVPVIRDCDALGLLQVGREIARLADAARTRSIPREQLVGSTFTVSNVGSHAGRFATPIINYPECAILAAGRAREGMVVKSGMFRAGLLLPLSLACDHRVVDGATGALALAEIIRLLQDPEQLLGPARA